MIIDRAVSTIILIILIVTFEHNPLLAQDVKGFKIKHQLQY